jgi:hypothetical protein
MSSLEFYWRPSGHSYVARFGKLSVSVRAKGSKARGDQQWIVDEVFGAHFLGTGWTDLDSAKAEAEFLAIREARALSARLRSGTSQPVAETYPGEDRPAPSLLKSDASVPPSPSGNPGKDAP